MKSDKKITKEDIKYYFKYGPMDFEFKKAMKIYFFIDFPIYCICYWIIYFLTKGK